MRSTWTTRVILVMLFLGGSATLAQPLAQYTFNDGSTTDITGNGYNGVLLGDAAVVADAERGQVLQINQSGMQIDGPFEITTEFTLSAWFKLDLPRTGRFYFGGPWQFRTDNQGDPEHEWIEIRYPDGTFQDKLDTRTADNPDGQLDGQWHHLTLVVQEDGVIRPYMDGVLAPVRDGKVSAHDFGGAIGPIFIGSQNDAGGNAIQGSMDDVRIFNYAVADEDIPGLMIEGSGAEYASSPKPESGATDVLRDTVLNWQAGSTAASRDVYLGTDFEDVNSADTGSPLQIGAGLTETSLAAGRLDFNQTYFWRVDEVNAPPDATVFRGDIWSFTTEPEAYVIDTAPTVSASSQHADNTGPENTMNGSGLDANGGHGTNLDMMWLSSMADTGEAWIAFSLDQVYKLQGVHVWNHNTQTESVLGYGFKETLIETSQDGVDWTELKTVELPQASGKADYTGVEVSLDGIAAQHIRLTAKSNWSAIGLAQYGLSEVRFLQIPVQASGPQPDSGATDVSPAVVMGWRSGRLAAQHDVYLGTAMDDLSLAATVTESQLDAAGLGLELGQTYYWRVDEVNDMETPKVWAGEPWNLATPEFLVIDDMESYSAREGHWIWETWVDGFEDADNGSTVGHGDLPETEIVHGGSNSLPLHFDNRMAPTSAGTRTFEASQDWTAAGITTLVVHFIPDVDNTGGQFYVKVNDTKIAYEADPGAVSPPSYTAWTQWNIDLATLGANLDQVDSVTLGVDGGGALGTLYVDDIRLYKSAPAPAVVDQWMEAESGTVTDPMLIYEGDPTASGGMFIGTDETTDDSTGTPPADGIATYSVDVTGGVYRLDLRVITYSGSNSLWIRMPSASTQNDWINFGPAVDEDWNWVSVPGDFTLPAGTHTLEIARRESGALVDAITFVRLADE